MERTNPGVYKYREYGIYLYEVGEEKRALIFFAGKGMKSSFTAESLEKAYQKAVNEIDSYLNGALEED